MSLIIFIILYGHKMNIKRGMSKYKISDLSGHMSPKYAQYPRESGKQGSKVNDLDSVDLYSQ